MLFRSNDQLAAIPTAPDCNAGLISHADLQGNAQDGLKVDRASLNTFINITSQTNGNNGATLTQYSRYNNFFGGDLEGNTTYQLSVESGATENKIIGTGCSGTVSDAGTRTIIIGSRSITSAR